MLRPEIEPDHHHNNAHHRLRIKKPLQRQYAKNRRDRKRHERLNIDKRRKLFQKIRHYFIFLSKFLLHKNLCFIKIAGLQPGRLSGDLPCHFRVSFA
jgi:hypothetical protein